VEKRVDKAARHARTAAHYGAMLLLARGTTYLTDHG
jgi:hypothetical protein